MATQTVTIYGSGSAKTDVTKPNTVNTKETTIRAVGDYDNRVEGFEKFVPPESIRGKKVVSAILYIYTQYDYYAAPQGAAIYPIIEDWDPSKTSYANSPNHYVYPSVSTANHGTGFAWESIDIIKEISPHFSTDFVLEYAALAASFGIDVSYGVYYTSNSNYKPYIVVTVRDNEGGLQPTLLSPKDGIFHNNKNGVTVEWENSIIEGTIRPVTQSKAVITWSYDNITKTATINGTGTSYTIPASELPEQGTVTWKVEVTANAGNTNASTTSTFTTTDSVSYASPSSPVNEYIDGSKEVDFSWTYSISTGTMAERADFQISTNNGVTWEDLGTATDGGPYTAAPNTLPAGNVLWRVRSYNTDDVAGPWSDPAAIVVRRAPNAPIIAGITTIPQPIVSWQAEGQQAYQLQVGDWDSGTVYGTAKSAQVPYAMPEGPALVRLRIQNSFGLWSDWSTAEVTIANQRGEPIAVRTRVVLGGVRLTWAIEGDYPTYAILRDGKEIATVAGKEYTDYTGIGRSRYTVRGINTDSTYTDSADVVEILRPHAGLIAREGVWDWMTLDRRIGSRPAHSGSQQEDATLTWYSGRALPVAEISGHRQVSVQYDYTLPSLSELEKLRAMSGTKVVYKHRDGELFRGLLGNLSWSRNRGRWDVSFTITEVDDGPVF